LPTKVTGCLASSALPTLKTNTTTQNSPSPPSRWILPELRLGLIPRAKAQPLSLLRICGGSARRQRPWRRPCKPLFPPDSPGHLPPNKERKDGPDRDSQSRITLKENRIRKQHQVNQL